MASVGQSELEKPLTDVAEVCSPVVMENDAAIDECSPVENHKTRSLSDWNRAPKETISGYLVVKFTCCQFEVVRLKVKRGTD